MLLLAAEIEQKRVLSLQRWINTKEQTLHSYIKSYGSTPGVRQKHGV